MRGATFSARILNRLQSQRTQWRINNTRPQKASPISRGYGTSNLHSKPRGPRRGIILAATGGSIAAVSLGFLAIPESARYSLGFAERVGRVGSALFICINDYRATLDRRERNDDPEERSRILSACHKRCAERTRNVMEELGGVLIKLGQHLSAMNYLLPLEWTTTFIPLQDRCPVSSFDSIEQMFLDDTGSELSSYFSEFDPEPIGAASLAQVHLATIKESGRRVAVKVQHPGLALWAPLDMALTRLSFSTLKRFFPEYDLEWLSSEMELSLPQELDFTMEAENALRTKKDFSHVPDLPLVIPDVIWAKKRILVMQCESGRRLDDLDYLDSNGIDRDEVSATLARIFNEMVFGTGFLHCDPHGGNIAIRKNDQGGFATGRPNFDIVLYDHGLYRDIPESLRRSYAKMWLAIIDGDLPRMKKYVKEVANIGDDQFPLFASAITGRDFAAVSTAITKPKSTAEKQNITGALQGGMLADLVQMLGQVPRVILLILKTNDLTRSLDENLHTCQGPMRQFMILARYCARSVLREHLEDVHMHGSALRPSNAVRLFSAWWGFARVELKLQAFELWLSLKRLLGLQNLQFGVFA